MPNRNYKHLMDYYDHGIKNLLYTSIVAKSASCVVHSLIEKFTLIGTPAILLSDNGG